MPSIIRQSDTTVLSGRMLVGLVLLLIPTSAFGAPIGDDGEPFDLDFSQLGEEMYHTEERNDTLKLLEEWSPNEDGSMNPEEMGPFVQGDLYQPVVAKNAVKFKSKRWKNAIVPYKISNSFGKCPRL